MKMCSFLSTARRLRLGSARSCRSTDARAGGRRAPQADQKVNKKTPKATTRIRLNQQVKRVGEQVRRWALLVDVGELYPETGLPTLIDEIDEVLVEKFRLTISEAVK